jgi:pimeloyl-ACP methyl ester carboxylesterase
MLHGMTSHGDAWRPIVGRLSAPARCLCPDLRGHGRSDWTSEGYWLSDYAADLVALVDALGATEVDLVGHSLGARIAMVLAPLLAGRVRSVVLSDTGPEVSRTGAQQALAINASAKSVAGFSNGDKLRAFLREQQPTWGDEAIEVRAERLYRRNWAGMLVNRGDPEVTWLLGRAGLKEVDDMWRGLHEITAPTLILKGIKSFLLDDDLASRMQHALACGAVVELDLSHQMAYEDPAAVAAVIDPFLASPAAFVQAHAAI